MDQHALDDAAAAALWALRNASVEHIGLLYDGGDALRATPTHTRRDAERTRGTFSIPAGSLRGVFHNHPPRTRKRGAMGEARRDSDRASFSADDIEQARALGVPSYIAAGPKLRRYDPSAGRTEDVLAEIPIDEIMRRIMVDILERSPDDPRGPYMGLLGGS